MDWHGLSRFQACKKYPNFFWLISLVRSINPFLGILLRRIFCILSGHNDFVFLNVLVYVGISLGRVNLECADVWTYFFSVVDAPSMCLRDVLLPPQLFGYRFHRWSFGLLGAPVHRTYLLHLQ